MNDSKADANEWHVGLEPELLAAEFIDILIRSSLAERRPVQNLSLIGGMLNNADLIATARTHDGLLVGVARSITDFCYCTYLSDLAVDLTYQRRGIGKALIDFCHEKAGRATTLVLLAAPAAESYYPHIGLVQHPSCWIRRTTDGVPIAPFDS